MKSVPVATRINPELHAALEAEVQRTGQDKAELLRTYIRDGLAHYDSYSEQIMQTQLGILEHLKMLQGLVGAVVHIDVEQSVLGLHQEPNETAETYKARLQSTYKKSVFDAIAKGGRIAAVLSEAPANLKVSHDR
jgi:hypothetical protein